MEPIAQQIKEGVETALFTKDKDGRTRFGKEIETHIDKQIAAIVRKFWYTIIGFVLVTAGLWFNLNYEVAKNTDFRELGDRFTIADGLLLEQQIAQNNLKNQELKEWLLRIENKLDKAIE